MPSKLILRLEITVEEDGSISWQAAEEGPDPVHEVPGMMLAQTDMTDIVRDAIALHVAKISKPGGISTVKISRPGGVSALTEQLEAALRELREFQEIETPGGIFATKRDEFPE